MQICTLTQTHNRSSIPPLSFYRREILSAVHTHTTVLLLCWNLSRTTRVSRYQKGKTNLDLLEASAELYASLHLIPDNHANIPPLRFLQAGCPSCHPTNSVVIHNKILKNCQLVLFRHCYLFQVSSKSFVE